MDNAKRLHRRTVHHGRVFDVHVDEVALPNGRTTRLDILEHPGAAAVVPIDEAGQVILVRQMRYATGEWLLEVPAGTLDAGEAPEACAYRELAEETGHQAAELVPLGYIWTTPGFTNERIFLYLARQLSPSTQELDADEVLHVEVMPFDEAVAMAQAGEITDAKSVCALLRAKSYLQR